MLNIIPSTQFCDLIFELDLFQVITTAIHKQGNILNLVLTNLDIDLNLTDCTVRSDPTLFPSDHLAITFDLKIAKQSSINSGSFFSFNFARGDYMGLCDFLHNYDFIPSFLSHDVNYIWPFIEETITIAMHEFIPVIKIGPKNNVQSEINHQIKCERSTQSQKPSYYT